jgi:alpha-L-rhamnosidase
VQTYDVTALVLEGDNVLAAILADGWFRGQTGAMRSADQWGTGVALLAQLRVEHDDGTVVVTGWDAPGFDDGGWHQVVAAAHGYRHLVASPSPPVRRVTELEPVRVTRVGPDRQVVDLGQNINGWLRLGRLGPRRTRLVLTHGEHLDAGGDVTTAHLQPNFPFMPAPLPAGMVDEVVAAGLPGEVFEPRRTTHGFRYVRVEGHPEDLTVDDARGVVVHSDLRRTGWFACSDPRVDAFHDAAVWSLRGNVCDIPTDCPQRERAGWTGDWQLYLPTAAFLYDVAGFSTKWLRDVAADQWDDGTVANMSPCPAAEGPGSPMAMLNGSAGWGDASVIVPWELCRVYGDEQVLAELWPTAAAWLDRAERMARDQRHPDRVARRPEPLPHEEFLWDTGFHWGEWLAPGEEPTDFPAFVAADKSDVATAYLAHSAAVMSRIAAVLGRPEDTARYAALSESARDAWRAEYVGADGRLTPDTQANHVRALAFDLVPGGLRTAVADRLVELIRAAGNSWTAAGWTCASPFRRAPRPRWCFRTAPPRRSARAPTDSPDSPAQWPTPAWLLRMSGFGSPWSVVRRLGFSRQPLRSSADRWAGYALAGSDLA